MGTPYLHKIFDTISVRNSNVGIGTDSPQGTLHVVGPALFNRIGSVNSNIDFTGASLSNVNAIFATGFAVNTFNTQGVTVNYITTNSPSCNIDLDDKSLSNLSAVSTQSLTTDGSTLNISGKTLSNVSAISVSRLTSTTGVINIDDKSLSNISKINVKCIQSPQSVIDFQNNTLSNVYDIFAARHATIGGTLTASNLNIVGELTVVNNVTSNMEQLNIVSSNIGPALKVVQTGVGPQYPVAEFVDSETGTALYIADTGLVGVNTSLPSYRLDVYGVMSVRDIMYLKTGGMNKIQYGYGNVLKTTLGTQTLSVDIQWTNATAFHRNAFRLTAKLHVASERPSSAYRRIESVVTPVDDATNGYPSQLTMAESANCTNSDFPSITHSILRKNDKAVTLTFEWNASIQPYVANVDIEVFANDNLGNFQFAPV